MGGMLRLQLVQFIVIAPAGSHPGTFAKKKLHQRLANAFRTAGDHYHFIVEHSHTQTGLSGKNKQFNPSYEHSGGQWHNLFHQKFGWFSISPIFALPKTGRVHALFVMEWQIP
jgi:hypothetical protein